MARFEGDVRLRGRTARLIATVAAVSAASFSMYAVPVEAAPSEPVFQPNVVIIVTDDQRWDTIGRCKRGFDGNDFAAGADACMPLLQNTLIANGMTFTRGYVTTAMCCPSRASILTGQYSRHTEVQDNNSWGKLDDDSTLATWLDGAGYRTGLIGKYLNGYGDPRSPTPTPAEYVPPGWDSWHATWGTPASYTNYSLAEKEPGGTFAITNYSTTNNTKPACAEDNLYSTDLLCARALSFLRSDATTPFFLYFAPHSPHLPATPPGRWSGNNNSVVLPRYPNYDAVPSPNPPSYLPTQPATTTTKNAWAVGFRNQLDTNRAVDDAVNAMYQELSADGRLANTVFVYISDNSLARGEHRLKDKSCEFEECHRVPFVVACPTSVCPGIPGPTVDTSRFVLNIDIAPTIAELAGVTPENVIDGRSLVPMLNGDPAPVRSWFTIDDPGGNPTTNQLDPMNKINGIVSIRDEDGHTYKYVEFPNRSGEHQLYDDTADPWELANLADDGIHDAIQSSLAAQLADAITFPVVSITSGPSGGTNQVPVSFTWTVDEESTFECTLDASSEPCGSDSVGSITYPDLADGPHAFSVGATDDYNNLTTVARSFSLDTTAPPPPVLTQTPPDPNGSVAAFGFSDDEAGVSFRCSLDAAPLEQCTSPVTYTVTGGSHTFQVLAMDVGGNASMVTSYSWTQLSDSTPPTVTMTAPTADRVLSTRTVSASWTGSDDIGIDRYEVAQRIGTAGVQQIVQSGTATSYSFTGSTDTTYCLQVYAYDTSGNVGLGEERCVAVAHDDRSASITYEGATTQTSAPNAFEGTLTVLGGTGQKARLVFNGRKVSLLFRRDSASGKAKILIDGVFKGNVDLYFSNTKDKQFVYTTTLAQGLHTVEVAWTGLKNASSAGTSVSIDGIAVIASDSTPPDTEITSGPSGTVQTPDATFEFTSSETGSTFACSLDGQAYTSCTSPVTYSGLGVGEHAFSVRATDAAGNVDPTAATASWVVEAAPG